MKGTDGVEYNLNRILRVKIAGSSSEVIEYCPYDKEYLCPNIDAIIKYLPSFTGKNGRPGFSAKVTIYNPPQTTLNIIGGKISWPIGLGNGNANEKTVRDYYKTKCRVTIEAGYWKDGKREYNKMFSGYLNTSAYYRKGPNNILELYCHNIELTPSDINRMTSSKRIDQSSVVTNTYAVWGISSDKQQLLCEEWIDNVIKKFETKKAPVAGQSVSIIDNTVSVTEEDRKKNGRPFYEIHYIEPPKDRIHPKNGEVSDVGLAALVQGTTLINFIPNGGTFEAKMQEICDAFPGTLRWVADYEFLDGKTRYYFWQPKGTGTDQSSDPLKRGDLIIYNFQNLIEVPSIDGSGCFTVKMMFNPDAWPLKRLILMWDEKLSFGNISPLTKGVATSAQLGQFYPSLQAGLYNAQTYALTRKNNGSVFNQRYTIAYVTHHLSSRGNAWSTEVKTTSAIAEVSGG